ncbi:MAG: hypothetical protein WA840_00880 [Caulobacteraceae bacterium]
MSPYPEPPAGETQQPSPPPETSHEEDLLDEALEETFPASDPISLMSRRFN